MTAAPLRGKRIVTTRDEPGVLDEALTALGADVVHVPLIEIADPLDGGAALAHELTRLSEIDWVVVASRHGAARVAAALRDAPHVRIAAVGVTTAATLTDLAGRAADVVPASQSAADLVAAMPDGDGRVALVAQADRAANTLGVGLARRGYRVRAVVAYRTVDRRPTAAEVTAATAADVVTFASGSAAEAWARSFGSAVPRSVVAIGPATAAAATIVGLHVTEVAAEHSIDGLVRAVIAAVERGS